MEPPGRRFDGAEPLNTLHGVFGGLSPHLALGPVTPWLGGADISWIMGILVTMAIYYPWAKATNRATAATVTGWTTA